jgi:hypothetical protein
MISKCIAFFGSALMLAGCCALGNGCAPESGAPIAWDQWEREQAADQDDELRLKRKLMICRNCLAPVSARDDAAGSVGR